jgi:acyl carrier protein
VADQTYQRVSQVIADLVGCAPESIGPGQCLGYRQTTNLYASTETKPLELDSLDRVSLAMKLEDEFHIEIPDAEVDDPAIDHVGGLVAFIQGKLDARGDRFAAFGVAVAGAVPVVKPHHKGPMTLAEIMEAEGSATTVFTADARSINYGDIGLRTASPLAITATATPTSSTPGTVNDVLELTADMQLTNVGVIDLRAAAAPGRMVRVPMAWFGPQDHAVTVKTGLGDLGPIKMDGNSRTEWMKARDVIRASGLDPEGLLIPEWEWYAMREARA